MNDHDNSRLSTWIPMLGFVTGFSLALVAALFWMLTISQSGGNNSTRIDDLEQRIDRLESPDDGPH